jgi:hypothetical protein
MLIRRSCCSARPYLPLRCCWGNRRGPCKQSSYSFTFLRRSSPSCMAPARVGGPALALGVRQVES